MSHLLTLQKWFFTMSLRLRNKILKVNLDFNPIW